MVQTTEDDGTQVLSDTAAVNSMDNFTVSDDGVDTVGVDASDGSRSATAA